MKRSCSLVSYVSLRICSGFKTLWRFLSPVFKLIHQWIMNSSRIFCAPLSEIKCITMKSPEWTFSTLSGLGFFFIIFIILCETSICIFLIFCKINEVPQIPLLKMNQLFVHCRSFFADVGSALWDTDMKCNKTWRTHEAWYKCSYEVEKMTKQKKHQPA